MFEAILEAKGVKKGESVIRKVEINVKIQAQNKREAKDNLLLAFITRKPPFGQFLEDFDILGKISYKIFAAETN